MDRAWIRNASQVEEAALSPSDALQSEAGVRLARSLIRPLIHSLIHSFTHALTRPLIHQPPLPPVYPTIHSFSLAPTQLPLTHLLHSLTSTGDYKCTKLCVVE